jgi:hypothetical protein
MQPISTKRFQETQQSTYKIDKAECVWTGRYLKTGKLERNGQPRYEGRTKYISVMEKNGLSQKKIFHLFMMWQMFVTCVRDRR